MKRKSAIAAARIPCRRSVPNRQANAIEGFGSSYSPAPGSPYDRRIPFGIEGGALLHGLRAPWNWKEP